MRFTTLFLIATAGWLHAQDAPRAFALPTLKGQSAAKAQEIIANAKTPANAYGSLHEAAIAALKAGNLAAEKYQYDKAYTLLLIAIRRDSNYPLAVFNLGVLCDRQGKTDDALKFYERVTAMEGTAPELKNQATAALRRLQLRAAVLSAGDGEARLQYIKALVDIYGKRSDTAVALAAALDLSRKYLNSWEAPALAGVLQAELGNWAESAESLKSSLLRAPVSQHDQLSKAAEIAGRQARYEDALRIADDALDNRRYREAAQNYSQAWDLIPYKVDAGFQASVAYLMADDLTHAVPTLGKLREVTDGEPYDRASAMLHELVPVSPEARKIEQSSVSSHVPAKQLDAATLTKRAVGELVTPDMSLEARSPPDLKSDPTAFIAVPDSDLTAQPTLFTSGESIFDAYQRAIDVGNPPADITAAAIPSTPGIPSTVQTTPSAAGTAAPSSATPVEERKRPALPETKRNPN